ncbi:protein C2-DOMAIN ABA-RELATED 11-like [Notolabrus celidotus]|uniref:protein C2-DOMAIN ABA-RELATED 11-like n=1 Tax=Notolabrus celidotus TaxID=1203425 RepID=UPI00148FF2B0|nr:protein C2-DOMAIN ABA-RELATED 11-like [Notolabrus celidotus]
MKLAVFACMLMVLPFLAEAGSCVGKRVDVWVIKGHDLTGDGLQSPDPYVIVRIGSDTKKTRIISSDAYPVWYQKLHFQRASTDLMKIEVWDADTLTNDDHLGTCLEPMESGGTQWHPIVCKTDDGGDVKLFYKCF